MPVPEYIESASIASAYHAILNYLSSKHDHKPFFVMLKTSTAYQNLLASLSLARIKISNFCLNSDQQADLAPNLGELYCQLANLQENSLLLGLGEYIYLFGQSSDLNQILYFDLPFNKQQQQVKCVVLCRYQYLAMRKICQKDVKINRYCYFVEENTTQETEIKAINKTYLDDLDIIQLPNHLDLSNLLPAKSLKKTCQALLHSLEEASANPLYVQTLVPLNNVRHYSIYDLALKLGLSYNLINNLTEEQCLASCQQYIN